MMFSNLKMAMSGTRPGALLALGTALLLSACQYGPDSGKGKGWPQNWSPQQQVDWYEASQGSRLLPLSWFMALERAGSSDPVADQAWLAEQFRFLPSRTGRPTPLPVGFAIDDGDDEQLSISRLRWYAGQGRREKWVGLNCSACHTAEVSYMGTPIRIDGGPALVDFQRFVEAIDGALKETLSDEAKFARFADKVLASADRNADAARRASNRTMLKAELAKLVDWQKRTDEMNETPLRYGFARVDAFGHIYNKVALFMRPLADPTNNPADAPVSYPYIWDIHRHDLLQYNGIAKGSKIKLPGGTLDYGALGRNTGEVLGVFGDVVVDPKPGLRGFVSSVQVDSLNRLENQLATLKAPKWPAQFPAIDAALADRGKGIFATSCRSCHDDTLAPDAAVKIKMIPLFDTTAEHERTDPWMACNAFTYETASGKLEGVKSDLFAGPTIGPIAQNAGLLATTVKGALLNKKSDLVSEVGLTFFGIYLPPRVVDTEGAPTLSKAQRLDLCRTTKHELLAYKSRPLNGIWATAPYLHNGSVPTLHDLLLPATQRPKSFFLGTRDFDPEKVGYVTAATAAGNSFEYRTDDPAGGNSSAGHEYGARTLSEADRKALLEYLKVL
jgi:hypothetical protein